MSTKFTPPPWTFHPDAEDLSGTGVRRVSIVAKHNGQQFIVCDMRLLTEITVNHENFIRFSPPDEVAANARLIAAAPALYEACKQAVTGLEEWMYNSTEQADETDENLLANIKTAIAKAEGGD